jgi:hypothetical protein
VTDPYLYADPERLIALASPYYSHGQTFDRIGSYISQMHTRYAPAWGDDDTGNHFKPQYDQTMGLLLDTTMGVGKTLTSFGDGLLATGRLFSTTEQGANDASRLYLSGVQGIGAGDDSGSGSGGSGAKYALRATEGKRLVPLESGVVERERDAPLLPLESAVTIRERDAPLLPVKADVTVRRPAEPLEPALMLRAQKDPALPAYRGEAPLLPLQPGIMLRHEEAPLLPVTPFVAAEGQWDPALPLESLEAPSYPVTPFVAAEGRWDPALPEEPGRPLLPTVHTRVKLVRGAPAQEA